MKPRLRAGLAPAMLIAFLALGGCSEDPPEKRQQPLACPLPSDRPAGMTVIVLAPGVMPEDELRRILLNPSNRQLTNVYDSRGVSLYQCRGQELQVFTNTPREVLAKYSRRRGNTPNTASAMSISTLQDVILPDVVTSYREHLEHVRLGTMPGTLADPAWGQVNFRFVLARPLRQDDNYPVQEYSCETSNLHARRVETSWKAALRDLRLRGYTPGILAVDVFMDAPAVPRAGLYALGVNIGMRTRGKNARFYLHDNPQCFFRGVREARTLRLGWNNCSPVKGNIAPTTCPDADAPMSNARPSTPEGTETPHAPQPTPPDSPAPDPRTGGLGPPAMSPRKSPSDTSPSLPPANGIRATVTETIFVRMDGKTLAPRRATARLLAGRSRLQLSLFSADHDTPIAHSNTGSDRVELLIPSGISGARKAMRLVLFPEREACARKEIVAVEIRLEGERGEFLGLTRHFHRLSIADCVTPLQVARREK